MVPPLKNGKHRTSKGYVRYSAGPHRNKYEHRVVVGKMVDALSYYSHTPGEPPVSYILRGKERRLVVHHVDGNRSNNHPENLMLMDESIHNNLRAFRFSRARAAGAPDWVVMDDPYLDGDTTV